jgi:peroxiredoxin
VTFIVAPDGTIADVDTSVNVNTHAADILKRLDTLKLKADTNTSANQKVAVDAPVTAFTLPDVKGQNTTIGNWNAENTKATVLLWVSVQCPVSNAYNTRMAQIANEYKAKGVRVFGINSNRAEAPAQIAQHATENNLGFPILKDANNVIADRFTAQVTPEAYIIDDKGVLRYHGRIDDSQNASDIKSRDLNAALDAVLAGQDVPNKKTRAFGCAIKRVNG